MKEAMLEILRKGNDVHEFTSEIAEMMTVFIEWSNDYWFSGCDKIWDVDSHGIMTTNELFNYWVTEIYKKQK